MIMRHWMDCPITTYGRLREWRIFTRRKGEIPNADTGEVCFDIDCYGRAVVLPGVTTEPACYAEENLVSAWCVASGEGVLLVEGEEHPICAGSSCLIPPEMEHRYRNTGADELEFIFSRRPPASTDGGFQLFHWTEDRPESQWGSLFQGHWNHIYRGPSSEVHIADLPPHKFSHPHNHPDGLDEIWYVHQGHGWHWMGRDYRPHYPGYALWLDPSELHTLMNPGETTVEYIYATSAFLLYDPQRNPPPSKELPSTPDQLITALEETLRDLTEAYRKPDVGIHGVALNIARFERLLAALKKE